MTKRIGLRATLSHWKRLWRDLEFRKAENQARAAFNHFRRVQHGSALRHDLTPPEASRKRAMIASINYMPWVPMEAWIVKSLQAAGFSATFLAEPRPDLARYFHLAGTRSVVSWSDYPVAGDPAWVGRHVPQLHGIRDWLGLKYEGVHVGRFALASVMRRLKQRIDFGDPPTRELLQRQLQTSVRHVSAGMQLLDTQRPACLLFTDRGYSGQGELFDLSLSRGIDTISWGDYYRNNLLTFKRYHSRNEREHPASLSSETWQALLARPWRSEWGHEVREVLRDSYASQDWFGSYGVQFGKRLMARHEVRARLGLSPTDKVAVIFPHILWDGSFFWGDDLFDDYTQWFEESLRAAGANREVKWVIKLHPGHVVKSRREHITEKPAEVQAVERVLGRLPDHMRLIYPNDEVSTFSLYDAMDYAVTVRGTVGMEASLFGVPVVTAGTGRYDRRGFTLDSESREQYLRTIATLQTRPRLTAEQVELAERYAYGVFLCRPLRLESVSLISQHDAVASTRVDVHCRSKADWQRAPDVRRLAGWLADGNAEDIFAWPPQ